MSTWGEKSSIFDTNKCCLEGKGSRFSKRHKYLNNMQTMGSVWFVLQLTFIAIQKWGITRLLQKAVDTVRLYLSGNEIWLLFPLRPMHFFLSLKSSEWLEQFSAHFKSFWLYIYIYIWRKKAMQHPEYIQFDQNTQYFFLTHWWHLA